MKKHPKSLIKRKNKSKKVYGKLNYIIKFNRKKITKKKLLGASSKKEIKPINVIVPSKKKKTRRSRSPSKIYFDESTEKAITTYNNLPDWAYDERNKIYEEKIKFPFEKLVENIFNTFKFSYFETSSQDVQKETISHLVANMHKYDRKKGKAFSYFSIVAKHFLIHQNNSNYKRFNQNVDISEERDENTVQLQSIDSHVKSTEIREFMKLIVNFWEKNVNKIFTRERDLTIANAVIELLRTSDRIDSFNKKALYIYIREMSSCKTQQITKVINKMKMYQSSIYKSYQTDGHINIESQLRLL